MNKLYTALILCLCISLNCWSQTYTISGIITDNSDESLPFVNVYLSKVIGETTTIIAGSTTEENGLYTISNIEQGEYVLAASFLGFKTYTEQIRVNTNITLNIQLETEVESLDEVEINVKKPTLRREADRLVFNVANTALSEGNVLELLTSTPGVLVLDNSISVKNEEPTVYINNRKVHLSATELAQLLEGTSASSIQSIEVITNPSARYDADTSTVLNIVMTKNLITGYNGSVFSNFTQGVFPKYSHGITNFFKGAKINANVNYTYNHRKVDRVNREAVNYLDAGNSNEEQWLSNLNRNTWLESHTISSNIDFNFNERNVLSFSSNLLFLPYFKYVIRNTTEIIADQPGAFTSFNSNNLSRDNKHNLGFDLNYAHTFDNQSQLLLNTHYTNYDYERSQGVNSIYFLQGVGEIDQTAFNSLANQDTNILTGQIDYVLPIKGEAQLESGIKASNVQTTSSLNQNDIINGQEIPNIINSDAFEYDEDVYAAYINFTKSWEKLSFGLGLRTELTKIDAKSVSQNQNSNQDYTEWFPNANIRYQSSDKTSFYSSYKRSIARPEYSDLNPFRFFLNDNNLVTGNPSLLPEFMDHVKVGVSFNDALFFEAYFKHFENKIEEFPIQDNATNIISYTPINLVSTEDFGFDVVYNFNVTENWYLYFVGSVFKIKDVIELNGIRTSQELWSTYFETSNNITLLKDKSLAINISGFYLGPNLQGLQEVGGRLASSISLRKTILKEKGVISLSFSDLFNEQDFIVTTRFLNQNSSLFTNLDNRYVRLGFRYKFGNTGLTTNEKELDKDERDRLEDN